MNEGCLIAAHRTTYWASYHDSMTETLELDPELEAFHMRFSIHPEILTCTCTGDWCF